MDDGTGSGGRFLRCGLEAAGGVGAGGGRDLDGAGSFGGRSTRGGVGGQDLNDE